MTKKWEVTVNGTNNVIEYKAGFGAKIEWSGVQGEITELVGDDGGLSNYDR